MSAVRLGGVVPCYDNPATIADVVAHLRERLPLVIVVDDGSHAAGRAAIARLADRPGVVVLRHATNRGKGAAVKTALVEAARRGLTHVVQVDADGQHDLRDVERFVRSARRSPDALILGAPRFDATLPSSRRLGHRIANFWTRLHVADAVEDAQCGFRVYPVARTLALGVSTDRMAFDTEIAVRMVWEGVPIVQLPTRVRYLPAHEGGVSHFRVGLDVALIVWMHVRLLAAAFARWVLGHRLEPA